MIKCKRLFFIIALLLFILMPCNTIFAADSLSEEVNVNINENQINVSGKLNEANKDITIVAYRYSDNSKAYIDQGKTDGSGNFSFSFSLPNGTYFAVISVDGKQYTTEKIVVYKAPDGEEPEEINININENIVSITGKTNEKNQDITLIVYKESDNSKAYIDQGKTDGSGNFSFSFSLPNGTYFAVISIDGKQYTTEKIVVYKAPDGEEPEEINVNINENIVTVSGKINEKNHDITLIVYKESDNSKAYIDQGNTDGSGNFSFSLALSNGTYFAVISTDEKQYATDIFIVQYNKPIISAEISPISETFDKNTTKQRDVTTCIIWNDAEQVTDVKIGNSSIGADNYKLDNYKLTIKKEFLATHEQGNLVLKVEFDKGLSATFSINIIDSTTNGGSSGGKGKEDTPALVPEPIILPSDIDGHWAKEYIIELIKRGIVSNYPDNTFRPDMSISRAEFVTIIVKTFGLESHELNIFNDTEDHWAKNYISAAIENKIILGYGNNMFGPDNMITREQMSIIISKAMKLNIEFSELQFEDNSQISDWAVNYVATTVRGKIINGYPDNTFKPKNYLTRAEAATIIYNTLQK